MTISEAKQISIISYLENLGINFKKQNNQDFWYLSPLHTEKTPSFKVDASKNLWYDHAQGKGGNILDLVMVMNNCDVSGALRIFGGADSFSFSPVTVSEIRNKARKSEFKITAVRDLRNPILLDYIKSRGLNEEIAKKFLNEIYFTKEDNDKNLFAISFQNDKAGYETRNALFKGNIGGKAITTIKGKGTKKVAIFEGFMDFLSILTYYKSENITDDVIVLNSLALIPSAMESILKYQEIKLFLDNDKAGRVATEELCKVHPNCIDYSYLYASYKDSNDWLLKKKI